MKNLLLVCCGGAAGSGLRYLVGVWAARALGAGFPSGTLIVNVLGAFAIAVVMGLGLAEGASLRLFIVTGVLGGFTTYSSFNHEVLRLYGDGAVGAAALYVAVTLIGCLLAGALGLFIAARF